MNRWLRRHGWLFFFMLLVLACKKKQPDQVSTEKEPEDPNRCTYSTPDVTCPEDKFCYVAPKDLAQKDPTKDKIWGTCTKKRAHGEPCQSAEDCADPNASCDSKSDEADAATVCMPDE